MGMLSARGSCEGGCDDSVSCTSKVTKREGRPREVGGELSQVSSENSGTVVAYIIVELKPKPEIKLPPPYTVDVQAVLVRDAAADRVVYV